MQLGNLFNNVIKPIAQLVAPLIPGAGPAIATALTMSDLLQDAMRGQLEPNDVAASALRMVGSRMG
jgi:hypothetical protein